MPLQPHHQVQMPTPQKVSDRQINQLAEVLDAPL
jgi:hypothetical protein